MDFRHNMGRYIKDLENELYILVANEVNYKNSFVMMNPKAFSDLLITAGDTKNANGVDRIMTSIREKISEKYRIMRSKRN